MQVIVPHSPSLFLTIDVSLQLQDVFASLSPLNFKASWDLHVDVPIDRGLWESEDIVDLSCGPSEDDRQDKLQSD